MMGYSLIAGVGATKDELIWRVHGSDKGHIRSSSV
jgi:hypothetical protein